MTGNFWTFPIIAETKEEMKPVTYTSLARPGFCNAELTERGDHLVTVLQNSPQNSLLWLPTLMAAAHCFIPLPWHQLEQ